MKNLNKNNRIKYFTETLTKLIELNDRNDKVDDFLKANIKDDFMNGFCGSICGEYVDMLIDTLSMMWKEDKWVQDWICYFMYEVKYMKPDKQGKITDSNKKEWILDYNDVNTLIKYLTDNYTILTK